MKKLMISKLIVDSGPINCKCDRARKSFTQQLHTREATLENEAGKRVRSHHLESKMKSFMSTLTALFFVITQLQLCSGFVQLRTRALMRPITAFDFNSIIVTAIEVAEKADDYQYGAVAAPSWALPLGAVLVIATAAIPVLLKPGEEAIAEQRKNEEIMGSNFNKRKDKDLR